MLVGNKEGGIFLTVELYATQQEDSTLENQTRVCALLVVLNT
jgi:hypothetical protein